MSEHFSLSANVVPFLVMRTASLISARRLADWVVWPSADTSAGLLAEGSTKGRTRSAVLRFRLCFFVRPEHVAGLKSPRIKARSCHEGNASKINFFHRSHSHVAEFSAGHTIGRLILRAAMSSPADTRVSSVFRHLRAIKKTLQDAIFDARYVWKVRMRHVGALRFGFAGSRRPQTRPRSD